MLDARLSHLYFCQSFYTRLAAIDGLLVMIFVPIETGLNTLQLIVGERLDDITTASQTCHQIATAAVICSVRRPCMADYFLECV